MCEKRYNHSELAPLTCHIQISCLLSSVYYESAANIVYIYAPGVFTPKNPTFVYEVLGHLPKLFVCHRLKNVLFLLSETHVPF